MNIQWIGRGSAVGKSFHGTDEQYLMIALEIRERQLIYRALLDRKNAVSSIKSDTTMPEAIRKIARAEQKEISRLLKKIKI